MAIAASAIAFSIQKVENRIFEWSLLPLGFAILSWGISFYFGCKHILYKTSSLSINYELYRTADGRSNDIPNDPKFVNMKMEVLRSSFETNSKKASKYGNRQFKLVVLGGIFFILWSIIEMYLRTNI